MSGFIFKTLSACRFWSNFRCVNSQDGLCIVIEYHNQLCSLRQDSYGLKSKLITFELKLLKSHAHTMQFMYGNLMKVWLLAIESIPRFFFGWKIFKGSHSQHFECKFKPFGFETNLVGNMSHPVLSFFLPLESQSQLFCLLLKRSWFILVSDAKGILHEHVVLSQHCQNSWRAPKRIWKCVHNVLSHS